MITNETNEIPLPARAIEPESEVPGSIPLQGARCQAVVISIFTWKYEWQCIFK